MSLSKNPALVEFIVMVPPTASHPEYWTAGSAKQPPRRPVVQVSIYQSTSGSHNRSLRRALRWHQFPASQPPDDAAARSASIALEPPQLLARFAPESPRPDRNDWLATVDVCRQLDDSDSSADSQFNDDRDLLRTRDQQSNCSSAHAKSNRQMFCGYDVLVRRAAPAERQAYVKRQSSIQRQSSVDRQSFIERQPLSEQQLLSERQSLSERQPFSEQQPFSERQPLSERQTLSERQSLLRRQPFTERQFRFAPELFCEPPPFTER